MDHPRKWERAEALALREPCPCDACHFREHCAQRMLACAAFSMYLAGEGNPRWSVAPRVPRTAIYAALFEAAPRAPSRSLLLAIESGAERPKGRPPLVRRRPLARTFGVPG